MCGLKTDEINFVQHFLKLLFHMSESQKGTGSAMHKTVGTTGSK